MIKLPIGTEQASESTIKSLIDIGALYVDEAGLHANKQGIYSKTEKIPADRKSEQG